LAYEAGKLREANVMRYVFLVLFALLGTGSAAIAAQFEKDGLVITDPWTRATPGGATVGVGYLSITNKGAAADRLTGGAFENADKIEIHEMQMSGDKMTMRWLSDGLEIKPGETVTFSPGAYHLMFTGLKKPIVENTDINVTLTFEKAGSINVIFKAKSIGAMDNSGMMHDHMQ
jgi:hypothetical protein